jgi:hypothetical protein
MLSLVVWTLLSRASAIAQPAPSPELRNWAFVVGGDSRNCGDVIMPAVAEGARRVGAAFYWHLGDFRAIYDFDEDFLHRSEHGGATNPRKATIADYERLAWDDFIQSQLLPFGSIPVFLSIGNHETTSPKTRPEYIAQFADWINSDVIRRQRLQDDPADHRLKTYFHWKEGGVDFISLDNATWEQFDDEQLRWFDLLTARDEADPSVRAIVVGMHAALPDSVAASHSMSDWPQGERSGRRVYLRLLRLRDRFRKGVYVLASHSHFVMDSIFDTPYWRAHGGVLPGWIVGTTGAVRYALPPGSEKGRLAKTNVYGYLVGIVSGGASAPADIRFRFQPIEEAEVPPAVVQRLTPAFVHDCFAKNSAAAAANPR